MTSHHTLGSTFLSDQVGQFCTSGMRKDPNALESNPKNLPMVVSYTWPLWGREGVFPFRLPLGRKTLLQRVHTAQQCSVLLQSYARRGHHRIPRTRAPGNTEGRLLRIVNGPSHILLPHPQRNSLPVHCPSLDFLGTLIATFLPNQGTCHRWMPSRHRHRIQGGTRVLSARYNCVSATCFPDKAITASWKEAMSNSACPVGGVSSWGRWSPRLRGDEDEDGRNCYCCFVATGFSGPNATSSYWMFLVLFLEAQLRNFLTLVHMESILISIPSRSRWFVILTSNASANLCISSNECFRFWSFIISTRRIFSTWISASQSCQRHRKFCSIKSLFEFSWCCCTEVPRAPTLNISDLVRIDTSEGATLDSESPFHFSCTMDREICNLQCKFLTPTRHCAVDTELIDGNDDAKQLLSLDPHCSVSISVHLLCFSKLLETTHWFLWKEDVRFFSGINHHQFMWGMGGSANEPRSSWPRSAQGSSSPRRGSEESELGRVKEGVHVPSVSVMLKWGATYDIARWDVTIFRQDTIRKASHCALSHANQCVTRWL